MGTINYTGGNIITLGYEEDYYISDKELREWAAVEFEENKHLREWYTLEGYIKFRAQEDYYSTVRFWSTEDYDMTKKMIDDANIISGIIKVNIEPGYCSGFSITVDIEGWTYFDDWEEKALALSEVKNVQELLNKLLNNGLNVVHPGWCESWLNFEESKKAIKKAMAELRRKIKTIPCQSRYRKVG